jgi:hypothetical protein
VVLRVTKTYGRTSRVHNTLQFPGLVFEVIVRFGVGECFRNLLLDCVLCVPPSCVKDLPLRLLLLRIRLFAPSGSKGGENDRLVAQSIISIIPPTLPVLRLDVTLLAKSKILLVEVYHVLLLHDLSLCAVRPRKKITPTLLHCAERCTSLPTLKISVRLGESPSSGGPARLGLALRKTYVATGQPRALMRPTCAPQSPMRAVRQVGPARRSKAGCRVVSKRSTGCMTPARAWLADPGIVQSSPGVPRVHAA